jgi:hypothetical protein
VILLIIASRNKKKADQGEIEDWSTTGGKIISARLSEHEVRKTDKRGTHIDITYEPVIEYSYVVDDVEQRGNKFFPGETTYFSQSEAQEILDKHPVNTYVPVHYNPQDPSVSSLEERSQDSNIVFVAGWIFTAFGISVCCFTSFMTFIIVGKVQ